ncbi:MAG TPA: hypothetical protein VM491_21975 [Burkholderiaceae bacterium]|nr:hypothetical protein [Burkholderiaceae bacterium]
MYRSSEPPDGRPIFLSRGRLASSPATADSPDPDARTADRRIRPSSQRVCSRSILTLLALLIGVDALLGAGFGAAGAVAAPAKVALVFEEKVAGMFGTTGWETIGQAESAIAAKLMSAGFAVVDPQTVKRNIARDKALRMMEGDDRGAALAGLQFGAQIVITGTAISKNAGGRLLGTNMQTLQATVQARAIRTDDARVLAAHTAQSSKAHIDEMQGGVLAIREASEEIADAFVSAMQQLVAVRQPTVAAPQAVGTGVGGGGPPAADATEITVTITGLVSYRHLDFVQRFLESNVQGVRGVHLRQFASGTAELALEYQGRTSLIARDLSRQKFTGFRLEPTSVTPNRLDLRAVLER